MVDNRWPGVIWIQMDLTPEGREDRTRIDSSPLPTDLSSEMRHYIVTAMVGRDPTLTFVTRELGAAIYNLENSLTLTKETEDGIAQKRTVNYVLSK